MATTSTETRLGMGATPHEAGTTFRVWAPHADQVAVAGDFNDWSKTANPLNREDAGYWAVDLPDARVGHEYRYVITNGDQELWRIDPYARGVTGVSGNAVVVNPGYQWRESPFEMPPWNKLVLYELHIGTFNDPRGEQPGDLDGVIAKLPYLRELGINAIQLMPTMEFPGDLSWGYNPSHPFAIENAYGGTDTFKQFVQAAHDHGIAVIFDAIYNHFGPTELDLWRFDGWAEGDWGGIYFYNDWRAETPWGNTRPDYGRPEVCRYLRDNAMFWLKEYQVDGLRWDGTAFIRNAKGNDNDPDNDIAEGRQLMQWVNDEMDADQPWKISIAEDLKDNPWINRDTGAGGAGFDAQWDRTFAHTIRQIVIAPDDVARDMDTVAGMLTRRYGDDAFARIIFTEAHDSVSEGQARVPEEIWPGNAGSWFSKKRSTLGALLALTAPGIPMIFQGQEFLEDEWFRDTDPLDWSRCDTYRGILQLYRDMIHLRRNWFDTTRGLCGQHIEVYHVNNADKLLAFHRWEAGGSRDSVVVVANLANRSYTDYTLGFPAAGAWQVRLNSDWEGYDAEFGNTPGYDTVAYEGTHDGQPCYGDVGIGPYSVLLLSQDAAEE
ncbi:MAG: alpha-amylase family glycosyl hydrolase [Chloroflexaceae bacterium]